MKTSIPKKIKHCCRKCRAVTTMTVSLVKKRKPRALAKMERRRARWGSRGNQGRYSKKIMQSQKTKRSAVLLECQTCKFKQPWARPRTKALEIKK